MERPILLDLPESLMGARVVVRPFRDEDAPEMFTVICGSREHIRPWLPWADSHRSVADTLEFIRRSQSQWIVRESLPMGIFSRDSGAFLGGIGLHPRSWSLPSFEIGYWISKPAEGKGFVSEAVRLVTTLAFEQLRAQRVMIRCDSRNARSRAVPERLGYQHEGTLRRDLLDSNGVPGDSLVYSMLSEEYERARETW